MSFLKKIIFSLSIYIIFSVPVSVSAQEAVVWDVNNISSIGGNKVESFGSPKVIETDNGKAVEFQKSPDQLIVQNNPLGDATEWTIELIVKPYALGSSKLNAPRILHIQVPGNANKRVLIEMRVTTAGKWYFDGYIRSTKGGLALIDPKLTHDVDKWYNGTITYKEGVFTTFINGVKELTGNVTYEQIGSEAVVSLGARMNKVAYFKGAIRRVIFTKTALTPDKFDNPDLPTETNKVFRVLPIMALKKDAYPVVFFDKTFSFGKAYNLKGRIVKGEKNLSVLSNGVLIGFGKEKQDLK